MPDEAVLRIRLDGGPGGGGGGGGGDAGSGGGGAGAGGGPMSWVEAARGQIDALFMRLNVLHASFDPENARLWAQATVDLALAEKDLAALRAAELEKIAPTAQLMADALIDLPAELGKAALEIERFHEALDPGVLRQRAELEIALDDARTRASRALKSEMEQLAPLVQEVEKTLAELAADEIALEDAKARARRSLEREKERQAPTVLPAGEGPGGLEQLFGLAKQFRGSVGGAGGRAVGLGLDVASMLGGGEAAGALGGLGAAAGPAAVAVLALRELDHVLGEAVSSVGHFAASALSASDDAAGAVETMAQGLGHVSSAAGAAAQSLADLMHAVDGLADRYAGYSGPLAAAEAQAEVTRVLGDLRRSQEVAPALVRYIEARTELQQRYEDAKARMLERALPLITHGVEVAESMIPLLELAMELLTEVATTLPGVRDRVDAIRREVEASRDRQRDWGALTDFIMNQQAPDPWARGGFARPGAEGAGVP